MFYLANDFYFLIMISLADRTNFPPISFAFQGFSWPRLGGETVRVLSKTSTIDFAVVGVSHSIGVFFYKSVLERQPGIVEIQLPKVRTCHDK